MLAADAGLFKTAVEGAMHASVNTSIHSIVSTAAHPHHNREPRKSIVEQIKD